MSIDNAKWTQDSLFPLPEKTEIVKTGLILIDSTPSFNRQSKLDSLRLNTQFDPSAYILFPREVELSPTDMFILPRQSRVLRYMASTVQRLTEGVAGASDHHNICYETPVTSAAWLLFLNRTSNIFPDNDLSINLNYIFSFIYPHFSSRLKEIKAAQFIEFVPPEKIFQQEFPPELTGNLTQKLVTEKVSTFNECLTIAAEKFQSETGIDPVLFK